MKNLIFENIDSISGLKNIPKLVLKLNAEFKNMGFEKVNSVGHFNEDAYPQEMTLMVRPDISNGDYLSINESSRGYVPMYNVLKDLEGWNNQREFYKFLNKNK